MKKSENIVIKLKMPDMDGGDDEFYVVRPMREVRKDGAVLTLWYPDITGLSGTIELHPWVCDRAEAERRLNLLAEWADEGYAACPDDPEEG